MRTKLQPLENIRTKFTATLISRGSFKTKSGIREKILIRNVRDSHNNLLTDHVFIADPVSIRRMALLKPGDFISFSGKVISYVKGYKGEDISHRLSRPISIDYTLCDIADIKKINCVSQNREEETLMGVNVLFKNKKIALGVH